MLSKIQGQIVGVDWDSRDMQFAVVRLFEANTLAMYVYGVDLTKIPVGSAGTFLAYAHGNEGDNQNFTMASLGDNNGFTPLSADELKALVDTAQLVRGVQKTQTGRRDLTADERKERRNARLENKRHRDATAKVDAAVASSAAASVI